MGLDSWHEEGQEVGEMLRITLPEWFVLVQQVSPVSGLRCVSKIGSIKSV